MGLRIRSTASTLGITRRLDDITRRLGASLERIASGDRLARSAADPAGLAISERFRARARSHEAATRNIDSAIGLVETAEGSLAETGSTLNRLRELTVRAGNGTLSDADLALVQEEFSSLVEAVDIQTRSANFNGTELFTSTRSISVQVGTEPGQTSTIDLIDLGFISNVLGALDLTTPLGRVVAPVVADAAIEVVSTLRGELGAAHNTLSSARRSAAAQGDAAAAAASRIRDADIALETAEAAKLSILQQANLAVLAQANVQPQLALELLQFD